MKMEETKILHNGTYNILNHPNELLYKNENKINLSVSCFCFDHKAWYAKKKK
jgi:hypothetical protein